MTMSVRTVDEIMPPTIGTAIRCITSDPVPVLHRIGSSPAMIGESHHLREVIPSVVAGARRSLIAPFRAPFPLYQWLCGAPRKGRPSAPRATGGPVRDR